MSYIDGNLLAGERVVYRTRLYWLLFLGPIALLVFLSVPIVWLVATSNWNNLAWIPVVAVAVILLGAIVKWQTSDFAVTNKRVVMKVGFFSTRSIELLLSKIEAIAVHQSLLGRIFSYGDIVLTGSGGTHESFANIQSPLTFRRAVQSVADPTLGQRD